MWIWRAYEERENLSDRDLLRLEQAVGREIDDYKYAIRNYPRARVAEHGKPHLDTLLLKLEAVRRTIDGRDLKGDAADF